MISEVKLEDLSLKLFGNWFEKDAWGGRLGMTLGEDSLKERFGMTLGKDAWGKLLGETLGIDIWEIFFQKSISSPNQKLYRIFS